MHQAAPPSPAIFALVIALAARRNLALWNLARRNVAPRNVALWIAAATLTTALPALAASDRWSCEQGGDGGWVCIEHGRPPPDRPPPEVAAPAVEATTAPTPTPAAATPAPDASAAVPATVPAVADSTAPTTTESGTASAPAAPTPPPLEGTAEPAATTAAGPAAAADDDSPTIVPAHNLDWVKLEDLSPDQRVTLAPGCCGAYVEPNRDYADAELDPETAPTQASAETTEAVGDIAKLSGDVQVVQGYRQLRSDNAEVDRTGRKVTLTGNVQFREPGLLMIGDQAALDIDAKEVRIDHANFVLHRSSVRGSAEKLVRTGDEVIYFDNSTYTTCEPGDNTWQLKSAHIEIDPNTGMATARNVHLAVHDVPVFYMPWLRFPIDKRRASGLLFPEVRFGTGNGLDFAQPLYLNLAPNYDATLTPRYLQDRGPMVEAEVRHLASWSRTTLSGAFLPDDNGGSNRNDPRNPLTGERPRHGDDRWLAGVDQRGDINPDWRTRIDYIKVSDVDYFRDLGNGSLEVNSRSHLRQLASTSYFLPNWTLSLKGEAFQTLLEGVRDQYQQLPQIGADGGYRFDDLDLVLDLHNQYTRFDHRDKAQVGGVVGDRFRADYALAWDKRWPWGYVRPAIMAKHLNYRLDNPVRTGGDEDPAITVPVVVVDTGLFFEQPVPILKGFVQTLEPRLYYLNSKFKDQRDFPVFDTSELTFSYQQLFRDDRFAGGDRIGDTEQVTLGATSRLIDSGGRERVRASIGQILYLDDRKVLIDPTLAGLGMIPDEVIEQQATDLLENNSDLAGELGVRLSEFWRFQSDLLVDKEASRIGRGSLGMRYRNPDRTLFNAGYRYTRDALVFSGAPRIEDIEQTDFSFVLPVADNWGLVGRWNHDITRHRALELFGGVEYESCCWRVAVLARRWLDRQNDVLFADSGDYNTGLFIEFQFKGLGGVGKQVENILHDGVYGYIPKDQ